MERILQGLAALGALTFLGFGLGMWVAPTRLASELGMPLLDGLGRSTQIADLAAFFLTMGACIAIGLATGNRVWFRPAAMLLGLAASGRILAWAAHGAALAIPQIAVELFFTGVLGVLVARSNDDGSAQRAPEPTPWRRQ